MDWKPIKTSIYRSLSCHQDQKSIPNIVGGSTSISLITANKRNYLQNKGRGEGERESRRLDFRGRVEIVVVVAPVDVRPLGAERVYIANADHRHLGPEKLQLGRHPGGLKSLRGGLRQLPRPEQAVLQDGEVLRGV
eukprot:scaffold253986_cov38-Prasinocladus_malaysianus.AAC.1